MALVRRDSTTPLPRLFTSRARHTPAPFPLSPLLLDSRNAHLLHSALSEERNGDDGESSRGEVVSEGLAQVRVALGGTAAKFTPEPNGERRSAECGMRSAE